MEEAIDVLLVEDDDSDAELTMRALKRVSAIKNIFHVADGQEALDFIFCRGAFSGRQQAELPRLVVLDLKMPKVDGMEVLRRLKSDDRTRSIPVVLLTSSREQKDVNESFRLGVNSYTVKPVSYADFMKFVSELGAYWLSMNQSPDFG